MISERERRWQAYLAAVAEGSSDSLARLYDESAPPLLGLAVRVTKNKADAEEIILDVFEQVWRTARKYDPGRGSAWRWLTVLVRSRAIDRLRTTSLRHTREAVYPLPNDWETASRDPLPDDESILNQERFLIRNAVCKLPGEQRQALELAYFDGLTTSKSPPLWAFP